MRITHLAVAVPALALACGAAAPPPASPPPPSEAPAAVAPEPPVAARWLRTGGATQRGPSLPEGTLVLMGGRRALVRSDGTVIAETAAAPEPLAWVVLVPHGDGARVVAAGKHGLYRFDDPLGAPVTLDTLVSDRFGLNAPRLAAGPGFVAVWSGAFEDTMPKLVDVETGKEVKPRGWPPVGILDMAFRNEREGVVLFAKLGALATRDGGATFVPVTGGVPRFTSQMEQLERRQDDLLAFGEGMSGWLRATVDPATGALGDVELEATPTDPTLRWIEETSRDPLALAVASGMRSPERHVAFVEARGLLARIDLRTGGVLDLAEHHVEPPKPNGMSLIDLWRRSEEEEAPSCALGRAGDQGVLLCPQKTPVGFSVRGPLAPHPLSEEKLPWFSREEIARNGFGGLVVGAACSAREAAGERGVLCTLLPDGRLVSRPLPEGASIATIPRAGERPSWSPVAVLSDGKIAYLHLDSPTDATSSQSLRIVLLARDGSTHLLPSLTLAHGERISAVESPIVEGSDGSLRMLVRGWPHLYELRQPRGERPPSLVPVEAETWRLLRDGKGVAQGRALRTSTDGGATWTEIPGLTSNYPQRPPHLEVSALGFRLEDHLHLGWEGGEPFVASSTPPSAPPTLTWSPDYPSPSLELSCTTRSVGGPAPLPGPPRSDAALKAMFDHLSGPPPARGRRAVYTAGLPGTARLEAFAPDAAASAPTRWTLRWVEGRDPSANPHTRSFAAPPHARWDAHVRAFAAAGERVVLAVAYEATEPEGASTDLVQLAPQGPPRFEHLGEDTDVHRIHLGEDGKAPVLLETYNEAYVWAPGERVRLFVTYPHVSHDVALELGAPREGVVPVLLTGRGWAALQELPLGGKGSSPAVGARLPVTGWRAVQASTRLDLHRMPACAAGAAGALFQFDDQGSQPLELVLDKVPVAGSAAYDVRFGVRVEATPACVASVEAVLHDGHGGQAPPLRTMAVNLASGDGRGVESGPHPRSRTLRCAVRGR